MAEKALRLRQWKLVAFSFAGAYAAACLLLPPLAFVIWGGNGLMIAVGAIMVPAILSTLGMLLVPKARELSADEARVRRLRPIFLMSILALLAVFPALMLIEAPTVVYGALALLIAGIAISATPYLLPRGRTSKRG